MKKLLCLVLCLVMAVPLFASCGSHISDKDEMKFGSVFEAYIAGDCYTLDPSFGYTDDNVAQYLSLIFEGLTKIDADGKLRYALLDSYTYTKDIINGEYKLTLNLKKSKWSDTSAVTADDFLFSWKRLISPDFSSPAATLLYDIKNAAEAKAGDCSIDDVGIASIDTYSLEVTFLKDIDVDNFLRKCASIALVPLRENVIARNEEWAKRSTSLSCNGPFKLSAFDRTVGRITLQRNNYYLSQKDDYLDKYVIPYKIIVNFIKDAEMPEIAKKGKMDDLNAQLEAYLAGKLLLLGDIPMDKRAEYVSQGTLADTLSTMSLLFNVTDSAMTAEVRQALSAVVDRQKLADLVVFASPATGLINDLVKDATVKKTFRSVGGSIISTTADTSKGSVLNGVNVTLKYKYTEEFYAVANYLKETWETYGAKVTLEPVLYTTYTKLSNSDEMETYHNDQLNDIYRSGDYQVALIDYSMISDDAFTPLAAFATGYTGNACDVANNWAIVPNMTGFNDADYNALITSAFEAETYSERVRLLHDAEKMLLEKAPIAPLLFNKNFYMTNKDLKDVTVDFYGNISLKSADLKNYVEYFTTEAPEEEETGN